MVSSSKINVMEFSFKAEVLLTLDYQKGANTSRHVSTEFNLECLGAIDKNAYIKDGVPNKEGSKVLTNVLVQGLIGNIHQSHEKGYKDSAQHLREIISELEKGFAMVAKVSDSTFSK